MNSNWKFSWDWVEPHIKKHIVPDETRIERQKICKECDQLTMVNICSICNCFMPGKTLLKSSECPQGKWGSVE